MKLIDKLKDRLKDDELSTKDIETMKNMGILIGLSGIIVIISIIIMTFIFFYGSPMTLILVTILLLLRVRLCGSEVDISFIKILNKYFKISISLTR
jgi:hypothetical protein